MFNKKENNIITFRAQGEHVMEVREKPIPSIKAIPQWWKNLYPYINNDTKLRLTPEGPNTTVKKCTPSLDALGAGYIMPLWADIIVTQKDGNPVISWNTKVEPIGMWGHDQVANFEIPNGFSRSVFKYFHGWTIKTPPGWSSLIMHPIGYPNSPFKALTGFVDTDVLETDINTPIVIKEGFEGIIEKSTPMFQIIPVKRSNWKSEFVLETDKQLFFNQEKLLTKFGSSYLNSLRVKKEYK
jgi:hypothetical protein